MKVFLQHKVSLLYFKDAANWTANPEEARDFGSSLNAMFFQQQNKLEPTHVVLKFEDARYDIVLQASAIKGNQPDNRERL